MSAASLPTAIEKLGNLLGKRLSTGESVREHHGRDESWHTPALPDAVCFPESKEEVASVLQICSAHGVPVVPFGTGTGVEGAVVPTAGGVCIDVSGMNEVLGVRPEDMDCTVQPGVTRKQLNTYIRDTGLFFPIDPGADASLGGMAATRASGTNAVRYGTMRENVLSLTVALPDGRLISTGRRAKKSAAGYDLTRLFIGSEGTLGVIVELNLRLYGRPEAMSAARVYFDDVADAVNAVIETIQTGIPVARIELLDEIQMDAINKFSKTDFPLKPGLFLEFHGSNASVREQSEAVGEICEAYNGSAFEWTTGEEEQNKMWAARHDAAYATMALRPGARAYATDVCVPISRLADCIRETREDIASSTDLISTLLGHVGDGNFHYVLLVDPNDPEEYEQAKVLGERMAMRALEMGGTCTGEHGIGLGKRELLEKEFGEDGIAVMLSIKQAIDPKGIMNPGKIFL